MTPYATNLEHLQDEMRRLDLLLARAVARFRVLRNQDIPTEFQGLYISDAEIDRLMVGEAETSAEGEEEFASKVAHSQAEVQRRVEESLGAGVTLRLPHLRQVFGLNPFEVDLLLLALAPELDLRYQKLYAYLQDNVDRKRPSIDLALQLFCLTLEERVQAREIFSATLPLLSTPLLSLHEEAAERPAPLLSQSMKLEERIVAFLLGSDRIDSHLTDPLTIAHWVVPQIQLADLVLPAALKTKLSQLRELAVGNSSWFCLLQGSAGTGKKACAEAICQAWGCSLLVVDLSLLLKSEWSVQTLLRLTWREARLYGGLLYLDGWQVLASDEPKAIAARRMVEQAVELFPGVVFAGSRQPWQRSREHSYRFITLEVPMPDEQNRQRLWQIQLQHHQAEVSDLDLPYLASAFRFSGGQIRRALTHATNRAQLRQGDTYQLTREDIMAGCQMESSQHLISFAQKILPRRRWADLVLPKDTLTQLHEFCQQVRYRMQVYGDWGFGQKLSLGKGLIALFTGGSGTGKTLSAEVLATELRLDLYRVDLASVVSKYIGETEKNLSRLFEDAQSSNAILFFDEADALFGKRSDIKDAHDRYANIEVNYLLQRVEGYEGAIILASNLSKNIDDAFLRRLHFNIEFPFPNEDLRLAIWQQIFPSQAPVTSEVDFEFLARKFKIAGGNIKNVALAAAFRAADDGGEIRMEHLILALKREYQKLGKVCEQADFERYYDWVR